MRRLHGVQAGLLYFYVLLMGFFHLYNAATGDLDGYRLRMLHLTWVLPVAYLLFPATSMAPKKSIPFGDWVLAVAAATPGIYVLLNYAAIAEGIQQGFPLSATALALGMIYILLLLEGTRRVIGLPLPAIAFFAILYMRYGHSLPGILQSPEFSYADVVGYLLLTDTAVYSTLLDLSATVVATFFILAGFLEKSGLGAWFADLARALAGGAPGGAARAAILGSGLLGSINGSDIWEVYSTGALTLPLMKKTGYPAHIAGAVEAVAGLGGQLMPPVMGAAAFLMAFFLDLQYRDIMIAAVFPATLYYASAFLTVRQHALKARLRSLSAAELPSAKSILEKWYMPLPLIGLLYFLIAGYTPVHSALAAIGLSWFVSFFNVGGVDEERRRLSYLAALATAAIAAAWFLVPSLSEILPKSALPFAVGGYVLVTSLLNAGMRTKTLLDAVERGAREIPLICVACATAGIILGTPSLTGAGDTFANLIIVLAGDMYLLPPVLVMALCILFGGLLPTSGAYILAVGLGAPIFARLGFPPLATHLFILYYVVAANITPPFALAAHAASSITRAEPDKTAFRAMQFGFLIFVLPWAFCYNPGLLMQGTTPQNAWALLGGGTAVCAFACAWTGYAKEAIPIWLRLSLGLAGLLSLTPIPGLVLGAAIATFAVILFSATILKPHDGGSAAT